eukprot:4819391-Alexandrium_andersonii.AAC.1
MSASLVGSEMCIRDRGVDGHRQGENDQDLPGRSGARDSPPTRPRQADPCLLYTSDAADDM